VASDQLRGARAKDEYGGIPRHGLKDIPLSLARAATRTPVANVPNGRYHWTCNLVWYGLVMVVWYSVLLADKFDFRSRTAHASAHVLKSPVIRFEDKRLPETHQTVQNGLGHYR